MVQSWALPSPLPSPLGFFQPGRHISTARGRHGRAQEPGLCGRLLRHRGAPSELLAGITTNRNGTNRVFLLGGVEEKFLGGLE